MEMNRNMQSADWNCPSIEKRNKPGRPDQQLLASMTDPSEVRRLLKENTEEKGGHRFILPLLQNLESVVYGSRILGHGSFWIPGDYLLSDLRDIETFEFDLLGHPLIRALIETITFYKNEPLILELEAPLFILSALIDPMDLDLCFEKEPVLLSDILRRIADASAAYVKACVQAGCRFFSLADPVGTLNLVGGRYFKEFCGSASVYLMKNCRASMEEAVMHLCPILSRSLLMTDMVRTDKIRIPAGLKDYMQVLALMAEDPDIRFTGMTCLHDSRPDLLYSYRISLL